MAFTERLSVFFSKGVPVTFAGAPSGLMGNLDVADEEMLARDGLGPVIGTVQVVTTERAAVAALGSGDAITVDGVDYTVLKNVRVDDGKIAHVYLQDA
jgi:hypothetical protein